MDIFLGHLRVGWRCETKADDAVPSPSIAWAIYQTPSSGRSRYGATSPTGRCEKKADDAPRTPLLKVDHDVLGICSFEVAGSTMRSTLKYGGVGEDDLQNTIGFFFRTYRYPDWGSFLHAKRTPVKIRKHGISASIERPSAFFSHRSVPLLAFHLAL